MVDAGGSAMRMRATTVQSAREAGKGGSDREIAAVYLLVNLLLFSESFKLAVNPGTNMNLLILKKEMSINNHVKTSKSYKFFPVKLGKSALTSLLSPLDFHQNLS